MKMLYMYEVVVHVKPCDKADLCEYMQLCKYRCHKPEARNNITVLKCCSGNKMMEREKVLQLSSCKVQVCLSMGYLVRSMLQATVVVILQ